MFKNWLVFSLILVFFAFFEASIINLPLVFISVLALSFLRPTKEVIIKAFVVGLLLDFLKVQTLGTSTLVMLIFIIFLEFIKESFLTKEADWQGRIAIKIDLLLLVVSTTFGSIILTTWQTFLTQQKISFELDLAKLLLLIFLAICIYFIFMLTNFKLKDDYGSQLDLFRSI